MPRTSSPSRQRPLTVEDFRFPDQQGVNLPTLILGIRVPDHAFDQPDLQPSYRFKAGRKWHRLAADCGPQTRYYHATVLTPKAPLPMRTLTQAWAVKAPVGRPIDLLNVLDYREALWDYLRAECNQSFADLAARYLPIDLPYAQVLTTNVLPPDLDELIEWDSGYQRAAGAHNRWSLAILT